MSRPPTSTRPAAAMQRAEIRLLLVVGVFFGTHDLFEVAFVLVVGAKGRKVEDRPAFAEMLIEVERVVTNTGERKEQLVDAVLNAQRQPSFALLLYQVRGGRIRASQRCNQKADNRRAILVRQCRAIAQAAAQASSRRTPDAPSSAHASAPATTGPSLASSNVARCAPPCGSTSARMLLRANQATRPRALWACPAPTTSKPREVPPKIDAARGF